ncbi:hypothetical protein [Siphonobacter curvatus]|nr:hypothetical protein [Siphonobacter curvatus]
MNKRQTTWAAWAGIIAVLFTIGAAGSSLYINYKKISTKNWN